MLERLTGWARSIEMGRQQMANYWASPEGQREFEVAFLRSARLVAMLGEIAMRTARADGWALLSTAGHLIRREAPTELADLRKRFGQPGLKGVLLATELFDVNEESLPNGGTRTVYRINGRYELQLPRDSASCQSD